MHLKNKWVAILKSKGSLMLQEEAIIKKSFKCVEDILEFKKKADNLISRVFTDKETLDLFKSGIKESLDHFLNIESSKTGEHLAKFLDYHLKKSSG